MALSRVSVVLLALVAVCPILGNAAEIMMNRNECSNGHCHLLEAPQYNEIPEADAISPNKPLESEQAMLERPIIDEGLGPIDPNTVTKNQGLEQPTLLMIPTSQEPKSHPEATEREPEMMLLQKVEEDTKHQPGSPKDQQQPSMFLVQMVDQGPKQQEGTMERESPMLLVQRVDEGSNCETKNQLAEPTMLVVPGAQQGCGNEARNLEQERQIVVVPSGGEGNAVEAKKDETQPRMMLVRAIPNGNTVETKKDETKPTMMLVRAIPNGNAADNKNEITQPTMVLYQAVPNGNAVETKKEEAMPTMMFVRAIPNGNVDQRKNEESQPTMMFFRAIPNEPCCQKKMLSAQHGVMVVSAPLEERSNDIVKNEPTMVFIPTSMGEIKHQAVPSERATRNMLRAQRDREDEKTNEIVEENLEKEEARAEEEDPSMDFCRIPQDDTSGLLKRNHHIKKDLNCKSHRIRNNSLEEDINIGVTSGLRSGRSLEVEDHAPKLRRQSWKRAVDNKQLTMDYMAILDKAMGYPYKTPSYEINQQYNPWRRFALESLASPSGAGLYPNYFR